MGDKNVSGLDPKQFVAGVKKIKEQIEEIRLERSQELAAVASEHDKKIMLTRREVEVVRSEQLARPKVKKLEEELSRGEMKLSAQEAVKEKELGEASLRYEAREAARRKVLDQMMKDATPEQLKELNSPKRIAKRVGVVLLGLFVLCAGVSGVIDANREAAEAQRREEAEAQRQEMMAAERARDYFIEIDEIIEYECKLSQEPMMNEAEGAYVGENYTYKCEGRSVEGEFSEYETVALESGSHGERLTVYGGDFSIDLPAKSFNRYYWEKDEVDQAALRQDGVHETVRLAIRNEVLGEVVAEREVKVRYVLSEVEIGILVANNGNYLKWRKAEDARIAKEEAERKAKEEAEAKQQAPTPTPTPTQPSTPKQPTTPAPAQKTYKNCTELNKVYPHGVGKTGAVDKVSGSSKPVTNFTKNDALYEANRGKDRDGDGIACEKK